MQRIVITGNLTADPEVRSTSTGKDVCNFTVAVKRQMTEGTDFFRVTAWGGTAINCGKYLSKGKKVAIFGTVSASAYTAKNGEVKANLELNAMDVEFLSPKEKDDFGKMQDYNEDLPWE